MKAKTDIFDSETLDMKNAALNFLNEKRAILNFREISKVVTGNGKMDPNFHEMVKGIRKIPVAYIKPLYDFLSNTFIEFNPGVAKAEIAEIPKDTFVFKSLPSGVRMDGNGLECKVSGKTSQFLRNGSVVTDLVLVTRINTVITAAAKLTEALNSK